MGLVICLLALVLPPAVVSACTAPFATGDVQLGQLDPTVPGGPGSAWIVPLALLSPVALVYLAVAASALLARVAPRLLGPAPAERLAALQRHATRLAERNRLARELHDSVGHALSIVTVQAGAPPQHHLNESHALWAGCEESIARAAWHCDDRRAR